MNIPIQSIKRLVVLIAVCLASQSELPAAVIYSQTFTGGTDPLLGTVSTVGGGTWVGDDFVNLNGSFTGVGKGIGLAFTPVTGKVYDLTATCTAASGGAYYDWFGVAFSPGLGATAWYPDLGSAALRTVNGKWDLWPSGASFWATTTEIDVRLDTTGAQWTTAFYDGGVQIGATYAFTTNPTINYVSLVASNTTGSLSAFQLSVIPEPASLALLGLSAVALLRRRRR